MMSKTELMLAPDIAPLIRFLRGVRVILDTDLAKIYGVETRALNQALKRNQQRFPEDFVLELTREEILGISQTVISLQKLRFSRSVHAFTEHGALMAANILNSPRAVAMSVYVIRAFVKMREDVAANAAILRRLAEIDKTLLVHDVTLREILQQLRPLLEPPPQPLKPEIGFHVKEDAVPYRTRRRGHAQAVHLLRRQYATLHHFSISAFQLVPAPASSLSSASAALLPPTTGTRPPPKPGGARMDLRLARRPAARLGHDRYPTGRSGDQLPRSPFKTELSVASLPKPARLINQRPNPALGACVMSPTSSLATI